MEQLVQLVAQKTGLSNDLAKVAVETVLGFVKAKLPAPLASQLDGYLGGSAGGEGGLGDLTKGLGGLFGK